MLNSIDLSLNYKFLSRFFIMHKLNLFKNNFQIPFIKKIVLFFSLKDLDTFDDPRFYNYFFFFKFFLGKKAAFYGYNSFFNLGKTTFSIKVQLVLSKNDVYNTLLFFSNDILSFIDPLYIGVKHFEKANRLYCICYLIKDMNLFVEKKTNIGLFHLKDPLNIQLFFFGDTSLSVKNLLQSFKIFL